MATKTTTKKTSKSAKPAAAKAPKPKAAKAAKPAAVKAVEPAPAKLEKPAAATPEATTPAKAPAKAKREPKQRPPKKVSGLDLAAKVLAEAGEPLAAKTIAERVIAAGWTTSGATPHATLYAAMGREISKKGKDARFRKVDRGLFTATTANGKEA